MNFFRARSSSTVKRVDLSGTILICFKRYSPILPLCTTYIIFVGDLADYKEKQVEVIIFLTRALNVEILNRI